VSKSYGEKLAEQADDAFRATVRRMHDDAKHGRIGEMELAHATTALAIVAAEHVGHALGVLEGFAAGCPEVLDAVNACIKLVREQLEEALAAQREIVRKTGGGGW
jgi:hypothetical protein